MSVSLAKRELERLRTEAWRKKNVNERDAVSDPFACEVCHAIVSILDAPRNLRVEIPLGQWGDREKDCSIHASLFPKGTVLLDASTRVLLRKPASKGLIYVVPDLYRHDPARTALEAPWEPSQVLSNVSTSRHDQQSDPILAPLDAQVPRPRIIDPRYIDIMLLRRWLFTCGEQHHETCGSIELQRRPAARPNLLIDTRSKCLVHSESSSADYAALSYLWGGTSQFLTTTTNLKCLTTPGALDGIAEMPRTVREAIDLTRALDLRFLWVDALCITQDDDKKEQELNSMADYFANAYLTIVHADGPNANAGFRGLRGISKERKAEQRFVRAPNQRQLIKASSRQIWSGSMLAPWSTRAWTFQEEICSRRVLYFAHDSVRWTCRTRRWSEESEADDCLSTYASDKQLQLSLDSPRLTDCALPLLSELEALVNGFNTRHLTFAEDALLAFAGVATRLGGKFTGGLISGLPELFFDVCLLWRPKRRLGPPKRRRPSGRENVPSILPSWSWAGWQTEVTWPFTWSSPEEIAAPFPILAGNVRPFHMVDIHYHDKDHNKISINSTWHTYASTAMSGKNALPAGWSEEHVSKRSWSHAFYFDQPKLYKHVADANKSFWFPVPTSGISTPPRSIDRISFTTTTAQFHLGERHRSTTAILVPDGSYVGILWQHDEDDSTYIDAIENGTTVQLVAIIGCSVPRDDYLSMVGSAKSGSQVTPTQPPSRTKEVMQALWIVWSGEQNVASRKGTARVDREAWELYSEKRPIEVVLE